MLDLKTDTLYDSGKEDIGKTFHVVQVIGMNEDLWDEVRGLDSETWKGCAWAELVVVQTRHSGSGMIFLISREQCPLWYL